ncbi:hypothetical protein [Arthrobacter sp. HS15c]|uniref:hypothetical protein n=1 Tax=Arthrobacter sp. HS15c TaxID=3230279 RepID=UPI003466B6EA
MARRPGKHQPQEFVEALVVLEADDAAGSRLELVRQHAVVLQWLPPRIAIVLVPAHRALPNAVPGTSWYTGDIPADVAAGFTPAERLFVDAWLSRREAKFRPGDGLPWDAAGKEPPDWPDEPPRKP